MTAAYLRNIENCVAILRITKGQPIIQQIQGCRPDVQLMSGMVSRGRKCTVGWSGTGRREKSGSAVVEREADKKQKRMPRGRIELPSKDYPSHAWSYDDRYETFVLAVILSRLDMIKFACVEYNTLTLSICGCMRHNP
jgi:hypothetical protein